MPFSQSLSSRRATLNPNSRAVRHLSHCPTPDISECSDKSCPLFANARPFKAKRSRRNRRRPLVKLRPSQGNVSEGDASLGCSDSENDIESCCGDDCDISDKGYILPQNHWLQQARGPLARLLREKVRAFIKVAQYVVPPDYKRSPCKSLRSSDWQSELTCRDETDTMHGGQKHSDSGSVGDSPPRGYLHFACPFQALYPQQHQQCLLRHDLLTVDNVITHLQRHHMKPPYCPVCSETFDTVIHRDRHIIERACELRELRIPEGINLYQKGQLKEWDGSQLSNTERWNRIYHTVLPDAGPPPSPYLDQGHGRAVSLARDYWREHGQHYVVEFLESQTFLDADAKNDPNAQLALCKVAQEDLLKDILREQTVEN